MSNETYVTVKGRLVADPENRFTPSGSSVTNLTVATSASKFDKNSNEWKDKPTKFWRCAAWDQGKLTRAQNIANLLKKGDNVIVYGELETREYETKEGEKRSVDEIRVESIGKDLTFHGQAYAANDVPAQAQGGYNSATQARMNQPAEDPWATPAAASAGGWGSGPSSEPPF
jgi:single-strand DNA-binding protein